MSTGSGSGSSGAADIGTTSGTDLTTDDSASSGATVSTTGGDGGSGGGVSALLAVSPGATCEISIGLGGSAEAAGSTTTITCGETALLCDGGAAGASNGGLGRDGLCTLSSGSVLTQFKASHGAPGGAGAGARLSGATAGQAGAITVRY